MLGNICLDMSGLVRFETDAQSVEERRETKAVAKASSLMLTRRCLN